jgi:DNA primase small subunit
MRMPNTLHGKTGLRMTKIKTENLEKFDPFTESIAFQKGFLPIFVNNAYEFRLGDKIYGPYKDERITLPTAAAIFLLCKGVARLEGEIE